MSENKSAKIENLSFEEAVKELEEIVRKLDAGGDELDSSIKNYTRGTELKTHCEKKLAEAKLKVEKIVKTDGGELKTEPFDTE